MDIPADRGEQRAREAIRCTWIGAIVDTLLGIAKIIIGWLFHSQALVADGIHSLSDLATDLIVMVVVKFANAKPDKEHPYGHERFETVGTVFLGFLLVAVAGAMAYNSTTNVIEGADHLIPAWPTLLVAALSIASKEAIYRYTLAVGKRLKSNLLIANAWHSRTDAWSSIIVFVGIAGAMSGLPWLDSVAAFLVAIFVARIGWNLAWSSLKELVDTAIEPGTVKTIGNIALAVDGIEGVHNFKSRKMGSKKLLEMDLQVKPYVSTSEAHYLGNTVVNHILQEFDDIGHIIFHIDTEKDADASLSPVLPGRSEVTGIIDALLGQLAPQLLRHNLTLHYIQGRLELDLMVASKPANLQAATVEQSNNDSALDQQRLEKSLNQSLAEHHWFRRLNLWYGY